MRIVPTTQDVLWEQCWDPQACVNIPFDGSDCLGVHACVRIIDQQGSYFLELQVFGAVARVPLANTCVPAFSIGIGELDVCVDGLDIQGNQLRSLNLVVKVCIGGNIGPINISQCWDVYDGTIQFFESSGDKQHMTGGQLSYIELGRRIDSAKHVHKNRQIAVSKGAAPSLRRQGSRGLQRPTRSNGSRRRPVKS